MRTVYRLCRALACFSGCFLLVLLVGGLISSCSSEDQSPVSDVLRISGNRLVDRSGRPFAVRGYEMTMDMWFETPGNVHENPEVTLDTMTDDMIATGANAVRFLFPAHISDSFSLDQLDRYVGKMARNGVVVYLSIFGERRPLLDEDGNQLFDDEGKPEECDFYDSAAFFGNPAVKEVLDRYKGWLVLDASQECDFDDHERWERVSVAKIREFRGYGYTCPLTVMSNIYGRDLPVLLSERAQRVFDADPLRSVIFGWQAYWGDSFDKESGQYFNWYEYWSGMTLEEGIIAASKAPYPIQIGLDIVADSGSYVDYPAAMSVAQETGMGWLWWNWYPVWGGNNLSQDGSLENLTDFGREVIYGHPASVSKTAHKALSF